MKTYVDGFVIPIPKDKVDEYRSIASAAGKIWMEHGALEYRECIGEDLQTEHGAGFPKIAGCAPHETVVFAWIVYESREHRDKVNAAVMEDPRIKEMGPETMPFDCGRMAYGGFQTIVQL